jgi:hypothetical protein
VFRRVVWASGMLYYFYIYIFINLPAKSQHQPPFYLQGMFIACVLSFLYVTATTDTSLPAVRRARTNHLPRCHHHD